MKGSLLAVALSVAAGVTSMAPLANASDNFTFKMVRASGATCLPNDAHARVTIGTAGQNQNMHIELVDLVPNVGCTVFVTQHNDRPFGLSWYQGEITTDSAGRGVGDFTGIFSNETFVLGDSPVPMAHVGIWFADPVDAGNAGCSGISTPFDGDGNAGILVLSTTNIRDDHGPVLNVGEVE